MTREQALEALCVVARRLSSNALVSDRDAARDLDRALVAVNDANPPDTTDKTVIEAARKLIEAEKQCAATAFTTPDYVAACSDYTKAQMRLHDALAAHDRTQAARTPASGADRGE